MELEFDRVELPCLRRVHHQVQTQEETQEVRLRDEMPDIGRVLCCRGQVMLRGKQWRSGSVIVDGVVQASVLYAPEDGSAPQSLLTWIPVQVRWEIPSDIPDGMANITACLQNVDARVTAARKMMIRVSVSISAEITYADREGLCGVKTQPEDVYLLESKYPLCVPSEAGEKAFSVDEIIKIPEANPLPARILCSELRPEITDYRLLSDKLIFRGNVMLHILYADADGELHSFSDAVTISQYAELSREHTDESDALVCVVVTNLEAELSEDGMIRLKAGLIAQYTVCDCHVVSLVEDAYSPKRQIVPQKTNLHLPVILDRKTTSVTADPVMDEEMATIHDIAFYPDLPRTYTDEEAVSVEVSGNFHILFSDPTGMLCSKVCRWEHKQTIPAAPNTKISVYISASGKQEPKSGSTQLRMEFVTIGDVGIPMVTALEIGEVQEPDPDRVSLIMRKAGNECLWDIAKQSGSSVEMIRKLNHLTEEPDPDQLILIPVL